MERLYNPEDYFLVQEIGSKGIFAILTIFKVMFKADKNNSIFTCYQFSAFGRMEGERKFIMREELELYQKELSRELVK